MRTSLKSRICSLTKASSCFLEELNSIEKGDKNETRRLNRLMYDSQHGSCETQLASLIENPVGNFSQGKQTDLFLFSRLFKSL